MSLDRPALPEVALMLEQEQAPSFEVHTLIQKAAISPTSASDGIFSPIFVLPKKVGGWRLVVNSKALNQFIRSAHFKMESISSMTDVVQKGDFMGRWDLKDAHLSIPVMKSYLRFRWKEQNFKF